MVQMNLFEWQEKGRRPRELTCGMEGEDELGDWEWHIYTTVYKIDYLHKEPYSVLYGHLIGKKNLKKKKCTLFFTERNWHNVVKQLYSNKNK